MGLVVGLVVGVAVVGLVVGVAVVGLAVGLVVGLAVIRRQNVLFTGVTNGDVSVPIPFWLALVDNPQHLVVPSDKVAHEEKSVPP